MNVWGEANQRHLKNKATAGSNGASMDFLFH